MPPAISSTLRRSKKSLEQPAQDMIEVTESVLRGVFPKIFAACPWAGPDEVHEYLQRTVPQFDEKQAIVLLKSGNKLLLNDEEGEKKKKKKNPATEILTAYDLAEDSSSEKGKGVTVWKDSGSGRGKPTSKRTSPVPDPDAVQQVAKRPRKEGLHRDAPIEILDEEDAISSSSQHLPLPPPPGHSQKHEDPTVQVLCSADSVSDPDIMDIDSAPPAREKAYTNHSPSAQVSPLSFRQTRQPTITEYMNNPISMPRLLRDSNKVTDWKPYRPPTPHHRHVRASSSDSSASSTSNSLKKTVQNSAAFISTASGEGKARQGLPDQGKVPKKIDSKFLNDDNNSHSSQLSHKKNMQRNPIVEISSSSTRQNEKSKLKTTSSVEIVSDDEHKMQVTSTKSKLQINDQPKKVEADRNKTPASSSSIQLIQASQLQRTGRKEKSQFSSAFQGTSEFQERKDFAEIQEIFGVENNKSKYKPSPILTRVEIPSSQPSPPAIIGNGDSQWDFINEKGEVVHVKHTAMTATIKTLVGRVTDIDGSSSNTYEVEYVPDSEEESISQKKARPLPEKKSRGITKRSIVYEKQKIGKNRKFIEADMDEEGGERDQSDEAEWLEDEKEEVVVVQYEGMSASIKNSDGEEWRINRRKKVVKK